MMADPMDRLQLPVNMPNPWRRRRKCPIETETIMVEKDAICARSSPADWLGRQSRCCCCIPTKAASILICILSFFWAILEIQTSEAVILKALKEDHYMFQLTKSLYILLAIIFLLSTGMLMLGILTKNFKAINAYVWVAFLFNCTVLSICLLIIMKQLIEAKHRDEYKTLAVASLCTVTYHCVVFYFIAVVNTYEIYLRLLFLNEPE